MIWRHSDWPTSTFATVSPFCAGKIKANQKPVYAKRSSPKIWGARTGLDSNWTQLLQNKKINSKSLWKKNAPASLVANDFSDFLKELSDCAHAPSPLVFGHGSGRALKRVIKPRLIVITLLKLALINSPVSAHLTSEWSKLHGWLA